MSQPSRPRILPPFWVLIALAEQWVLDRWLPIVRIAGDWADDVGGGFVLAAFAVLFLSWFQFWRHRTTIEPGRESSALIEAGPYRWSRNPIYLAMTLFLAGAAFRFGSLTAFAPVVGFVWVITAQFIVMEERMLLDRFGDEYEAYRSRVRRWL